MEYYAFLSVSTVCVVKVCALNETLAKEKAMDAYVSGKGKFSTSGDYDDVKNVEIYSADDAYAKDRIRRNYGGKI